MIISFELFVEGYAAAGFNYETSVGNRLKRNGIMNKKKKVAGSSAKAPDASMDLKSGSHKLKIQKTHNIEIKKDNANFGQVKLHHAPGKGWHIPDEYRSNHPHTTKHIESSTVGGVPLFKHLNKTWGKPQGSYAKDLKKHTNVYSDWRNNKPIAAHYGQDRHTPYIQVQHSGLYHTGKDVAGVGVPHMSQLGPMRIRARVKQHTKTSHSHMLTFENKPSERKPSNHDLDSSHTIRHLQTLK